MTEQFAKLLARLNLEQTPIDQDTRWHYVGGSGAGGVTEDNRLFGGLVLAQAVVAATRTVNELAMHSMHAYFLRPGRPDIPIDYYVEGIKQGRNFQTRQVQARQGSDIIFQMLASYSHQRPSVAHQDPMFTAPPPTELPNRDEARQRPNWQNMTIDVRLCDPLTAKTPLAPSKCVWIKPASLVPDDPIVHLALLVFATDRAFLSTAWRPHADQGSLRGVSLDHSLWVHAPIDFNQWHLYQMHSPAARFERGLVQGGLYNANGVRVATVTQEGTLTHRPHAAQQDQP